MKFKLIVFLLIFIGIAAILVFSNDQAIFIEAQFIEMKSPAGPNSSGAGLHKGINGNVYLSWMETDGDEHTSLYFSFLQNSKWSGPRKISGGEDWFVNYADFPSVSVFGNNTLAAHNLVETGQYSYDINVRLSNDGGLIWSTPFTPHLDNTPTEHGFVSMLPFMDDELLIVWLDGRKYFSDTANNIPATEEMNLRSAVINKDGNILNEWLLDDRTCSCCPTDASLIPNGAIVVYRDRTGDEIRDMSYVRLVNGEWTKPKVLSNDNWVIQGCPVNGPAIDTKDSLVAVTWFTASNDTAKIKVSFSLNSGETFGQSILIAEGEVRGNVDVVLLNDGSALVSWVEQVNKKITLKVRRIYQNRSLDESFMVTTMKEHYIDGFPKMVLQNGAVYFAWTEVGEKKNVKTALLELNQLQGI